MPSMHIICAIYICNMHKWKTCSTIIKMGNPLETGKTHDKHTCSIKKSFINYFKSAVKLSDKRESQVVF